MTEVAFVRPIRKSGLAYVVTIPKDYIEGGMLKEGRYRFVVQDASISASDGLYGLLTLDPPLRLIEREDAAAAS